MSARPRARRPEARVTYRQDWPAYDRAQKEEKHRVQLLLRGLCDGIVQPPQTNGRPRLPLADVVYSATMQVYGGMSGRRSTSDARVNAERGLIREAPSFNSVFRYLEGPTMGPLLRTLVHEAAAPLRAVETTFATDSTGFATNTYARYFDEIRNQEAPRETTLVSTRPSLASWRRSAHLTAEASLRDSAYAQPWRQWDRAYDGLGGDREQPAPGAVENRSQERLHPSESRV